MPHTIEPALSGRATCRGCGRAIAKGELRLGERLPNPFADEGEVTLWFHLACGAYKRPEAMAEALSSIEGEVPERDRWEVLARLGIEHRRLPRIDGAERAPSGRARCRHCKAMIAKDAWRLRLVWFEETRFVPSGFIHASCAREYLGTADVVERAIHFGGELPDEEITALIAALEA